MGLSAERLIVLGNRYIQGLGINIVIYSGLNVVCIFKILIPNKVGLPNVDNILLQDSVAIEVKNQLEVDEKYLYRLGYTTSSSSPHMSPTIVAAALNTTKWANFTLVSYVLAHQLAAVIQMVKNVNANLPTESLLLYDLGLSDDDQKTIQQYCHLLGNGSTVASSISAHSSSLAAASQSPQPAASGQAGMASSSATLLQTPQFSSFASSNLITTNNNNLISNNNNNNINSNGTVLMAGSKCFVIRYAEFLTANFPAHVIEDVQIRAFRPLIIGDALLKAHEVLFLENSVRFRANVLNELTALRRTVVLGDGGSGSGNSVGGNGAFDDGSGVKGWRTSPPVAVSSRTHPKMYDYFHVDDDNFKFLKMISMDTGVFFVDKPRVIERILLPWIKCALMPECIHPIGELLLYEFISQITRYLASILIVIGINRRGDLSVYERYVYCS